MDIFDMHNTFRTLGQQMGMQLNRAILPESIDIYLNNAINEKIREYLIDGTKTDNTLKQDIVGQTMSNINTFNTLFREYKCKLTFSTKEEKSTIESFNSNIGYTIINLPIKINNEYLNLNIPLINPMFYLGFSISYDQNINGKYYNCRIVSADKIDITLNDYCNTVSKEYPICYLLGNSYIKDDKIYFVHQLNLYNNVNTAPLYLNIKYMKYPNKIKYSDNINERIDCDLPDYLHYEIVERAVYKFYQSIIGINTNKT